MGLLRKWDFFLGKDKKPIEQEFHEKGVIVVLQYTANCEECIYRMKKCCQNMKGVLTAELDEKDPELITVKGVFGVEKLVAHIRRGTNKIVTVIKEESAAAATGEGSSGEAAAAGEGSSSGAAAAGEGSSAGGLTNHEIKKEKTS